jgi:hypothetical protein
VHDELVDAGYQVTRWTLDVAQGVLEPKLAMSHMVNQNSSAHLLDHFVREAGTHIPHHLTHCSSVRSLARSRGLSSKTN